MEEATKRCNSCYKYKDLDEFGRQASAKDGLKNWCKSCVSEKNAARYAKNKERHKLQVKDWQEQNRDKVLEYKRNYYEKNKTGVNTSDGQQ